MAFGIFAVLLVPAQGGNEVDYQAVAEKLVLQCAGIQESDLVLITGGVRNAELLENIAVEVRKIGAFPLVTLQSDRMTRRVYTDVPEKYDSQPPGFELQLANLITATIVVDHSEIMGVLKDIPAHRIAARNKAEVELGQLRLKRKVRQVYLGEENGLYPTHERAKLFAMSQEELSRLFWGGVNVDYSKLQKTGEVLKEVLADGKQVHITNPNGTDLKVRIEGRPIFVSDGIISDRDVQSGGAACQVWLPAGEVGRFWD
jgi:leucyl aminopeptidase (aminopeptidase T)